MKEVSEKYVTLWLQLGLVSLILMVLIGGITRLTDSGLSITKWKPVTGILPPLSNDQWEYNFNEYKKYQEFQIYNEDISLNDYKYIYFWEYTHRLLGRLIGLFFLIPFIVFYFKNYLSKYLIRNLSIVFLLGLLQAFAGWYMVKSGLSFNPDISHYRLAVHLSLAFIIIGYVYYLSLYVYKDSILKIKNNIYFNRFLNILFILLLLQIIYGAFNAALKTSHHLSTFPTMNDQIIPDAIFKLNPIWLNFFDNAILIQFIHRYLGMIIMILVYVFCYKINKLTFGLKHSNNNKLTHLSIPLSVLVTLQFFLGIITLISQSSIVFSLLHQFLAILLFLSMIKIKYYLEG